MMTKGLAFLVSVLLIHFAGVSVSAFIVRKQVTAMHGMLFAMSMAMGIGLFAGTLFVILFQGQLLLSTVIGICIGLITGASIGSYYSFLALLEGMLSGVMAGMMGAMLGEMIDSADWDKAIMTMFTIALSICFLIIYEVFTQWNSQPKWLRLYQNPFIIVLMFSLLCLFIYSQTPFILNSMPFLSPSHYP
ncbi:hypothetical protein D4T97_004760 [Siminovitchia acidinfaciens]|uniref:Uncharacterized protein n=1 Tax=Siminovitchia acidinfaciens TaxID=2321395 RepID=A0A429Y3W0_9BACI|nr:hypothetical protein [Siminovitchia acidinfaciens]RST76105.1 hypothetical protein D4T97_004760 [Siminovitchia acidinfaciens]